MKRIKKQTIFSFLLISLSLFNIVEAKAHKKMKEPYLKYQPAAYVPYSLFDKYAYDEQTIKNTIRSVAEYQIKSYNGNIPVKDWLIGTFYSSFIAAYQVTDDKWYLDQAYEWGQRSEWDINKPLNADDVCPGQTYLDIYFIKKDKSMYKTLDTKLSPFLEMKEAAPELLHSYLKKPIAITGRNVWSWCDALYMAPPVYARMAKATSNTKYLEMMDRLYWDSVDFLYSEEDNLFHRNSKVKTEKERTPSGKKVFWSRGNGWVIGGLARMIEYLPQDNGMQDKYLKLFKDLAYSLAKYQMEDGMWRSSVNDPSWYPLKETSGSAFFVYAFAKGINEGWLPREYFMPVLLKGWSGLMSCVTPQGKVGYSQVVAGSPYDVRPHDSKNYTTGAFILAASEMLKIKPSEELEKILNNKFEPRLVTTDGAWTWYNDERVIFNSNIFYASYVKRDGRSAITSFGTENAASSYAQNEKILSTWKMNDDHNNASILALDANNLVATYATHGKSMSFYQRMIKAPRFGEYSLGEEQEIEVVNTPKGVTYQNLHQLKSENGRIYNFFRGNNFNPNFVYSDDKCKTWSKPQLFIAAGTNSNRRPYVKYISNGENRIDILYTDGHPRNVKNNSVYHMYYQKGKFYTSSGKLIKTMKELLDSPMRPEDGTLIFDGNGEMGRGWVYDLEYDSLGRPHAAFISSPSGDIGSDMRYWSATFNGKKWDVSQIAYAGSNLYPAEQHYAGGIALMPNNSSIAVISCNVDPSTGKSLNRDIYQLFKGVKKGNKWDWTQLTFDPVYDHLRPVIVRGKNNALFWFTGHYTSFMNYDTDIMMSYKY